MNCILYLCLPFEGFEAEVGLEGEIGTNWTLSRLLRMKEYVAPLWLPLKMTESSRKNVFQMLHNHNLVVPCNSKCALWILGRNMLVKGDCSHCFIVPFIISYKLMNIWLLAHPTNHFMIFPNVSPEAWQNATRDLSLMPLPHDDAFFSKHFHSNLHTCSFSSGLNSESKPLLSHLFSALYNCWKQLS